jgi:hypothetical protein
MTRIATDAEREQYEIHARLHASHDRLIVAAKDLLDTIPARQAIWDAVP